ncbi:hypothetical protein MNBD_GAMMA23-332 [hydrothermal vent metagenome]|uniref:Glycosyltransferase 2-like domain-containing protein n=1 Tax=hydrothermal vent metagenome TaxID=652676 RepID=A0A3B0ZXV6_9ZZZZ
MLQATLESINQTAVISNDTIRIVVVNNNSKDNTELVCKDFAPQSKYKFEYYFEDQQGLSFARNRALAETKEGIIIFTDDDVVVPENWLAIYIDEYSSAEVDAVYGPVFPEWRNEKPEWYDKKLDPSYALLDYGDQRFVAKSIYQEFYGANFSIKVDILKSYGGFDTNLGRTADKLFIGEETEIFSKLLDEKRVVVYNPRIYVGHVIRSERKTKLYLTKYYKDIAESLAYLSVKKMKKSLLGIPLYKYKEFVSFYLSFIPKYLFYFLANKKGKLLVQILELIRNNRLLFFYLKIYFTKTR